MSELNNSHLLRSIAKLIETPEVRALEVSLLTTLQELISGGTVAFYEVRTLKNPATSSFDLHLVAVTIGDDDAFADTTPLPLNTMDGFAECLAAVELVVRPATSDSVTRYIYPVIGLRGPVIGAKGVTGFLVVDSAEHDTREQELVRILLGFYRNYVSLLNDNQRDHLTGLLNRKSFDDRMMKIILSLSEDNKRRADKVNYCLAVLDIDHFKNVNDTYGHLLGDEVLLHFAQCMNDTFREYDLLFRVGGEEFVIVLRNVTPELANTIFERFRGVVENHYFPQVGQITASIGVTAITSGDLPVTVIDRADQALYYAKNNGRNQVSYYDALLVANKLPGRSSHAGNDIELF